MYQTILDSYRLMPAILTGLNDNKALASRIDNVVTAVNTTVGILENDCLLFSSVITKISPHTRFFAQRRVL